MAWLRIDDGEVLDRSIGSLSDNEYRARHALLQLCAREHRDTGLFHVRDLVHAIYGTPKGPKSVTRTQLNRLHELDLVRTRQDYTDVELEDLAELGIRFPDGEGWYRAQHWERYNPPRDRTNAERQKRHRRRGRDESNGVTNGVTNASGNGAVTPPRAQTRAPGSRPVPSPTAEGSSALNPKTSSSELGRTPDDDLLGQLDKLHPSKAQRERWHAAASAERDRVAACLAASLTADRPAAYLDDLVKRDQWPRYAPPARNGTPLSTYERAENYVRNALWQHDRPREVLAEDFPDLTPDQVNALADLAADLARGAQPVDAL